MMLILRTGELAWLGPKIEWLSPFRAKENSLSRPVLFLAMGITRSLKELLFIINWN